MAACPHPVGSTRCSECGEEGHTFCTCNAEAKHCNKCGERHSSRAMRCAVRKTALKEKERLFRQGHLRPSISYAHTVSTLDNNLR